MLVSFSVENYRSFLNEETFSMVASGRLSGTHEDHVLSIPNSTEQVLRVAVLYGANGAGKSNLFKALRYVARIALKPNVKNGGTRREAYLFREASDAPSVFDLQFIANEKLYRFGFKVNDVRITEEWLIEVIGKRERIIYERMSDENGGVKVESKEFRKNGGKLEAIATIGGPQNQSFLSTINATLDSADFGEELSGILRWFRSTLTMIAPDESYAPLGHELSKDSDFLRFAGEFLKASSTGVDHLIPNKTEISESDLRNILPKEVVDEVFGNMLDGDDGSIGIVGMPDGNNLIIEKEGESHFYKLEIQASHQLEPGKHFILRLDEESDGTKRLLDFIPALHQARKESSVYFIDEIDRSMHPILIWGFLEFFLKSCNANRSQIIVTTHESNLLDLELLRRDEIWFAEKDLNLSSRLYSLSDFAVRKDQSIKRHYLDGRFGAIPFLGNLESLRSEAESKNEFA